MLCGNQDKLDNLNELKSSLREYLDEAQEEVSIDDYLNGIALLTSADMQDRENCVRLMTIHTAKGLEFPVVFVCCMNEGMFPSRKIRSKEEMEEERRVAYVAMTRAENLLFLSDAEGYDAQAGGSLYSSRFLFNIDEKLLEKKGVPSEQHMQRSKEYIRQQEFEMGVTDAPPNIRVFAAGEEVRTLISARGRSSACRTGNTSSPLKTARRAPFPSLPTCSSPSTAEFARFSGGKVSSA